MPERAKKEKRRLTEEAIRVGLDIAKNIQDIAFSNSKRQFKNDKKALPFAVRYIADLKPAKIICEAIGKYEIPLAAILQTSGLPVVIINSRQETFSTITINKFYHRSVLVSWPRSFLDKSQRLIMG